MTAFPPIHPTLDAWGQALKDWCFTQHNADGTHSLAGTGTTPGVVTVDQAYVGGLLDCSVHVQALVNSVPQTGTAKGGRLVYPLGRFLHNSTIVFPDGGRGWQIVSVGGTSYNLGGTVADYGTIIELAANVSYFNVDAGATVQQAGPTFCDLTFDGKGRTNTMAVYAENLNRLIFERCHFSNMTIAGVRLYSSVDAGGGDSAWHYFLNCRWNRCAVGIDAEHSYGIVVSGGDFISSAGQIGIRWNSLETSQTASQWLRCFGPKFDGGVGVAMDGGNSYIIGCPFEACSSGIVIRKTLTTGGGAIISGGRMVIGFNGFGGISTACIDVGAGAGTGVCILPNSYNTMAGGVARIYGDAAARRATLDLDSIAIALPTNIPYGTFRNTEPADTMVPISGHIWWHDDATGDACYKTRTGAGTITRRRVPGTVF